MGPDIRRRRRLGAADRPAADRSARQDLPGSRLRTTGGRDPGAHHLFPPDRLLRLGPQGIGPNPAQARADIHPDIARVAWNRRTMLQEIEVLILMLFVIAAAA